MFLVFVDINTHSDSLLLFLECMMQKPSHCSLMSPGRQRRGGGGETCANKTDVSGNKEKQEQTEWEGVTDGLKRGTRGRGENDGATRASWGKLRDGSFSG